MPLAEVRCAGISYGTRTALLDSEGDPIVNSAGVAQYSHERHEAKMGDIVELSQHEFDFHYKLGGVQAPGEAPLPGSPGHMPGPTPFGIPVPREAGGEPVAWAHPIMGDPEPGADKALTAEKLAELEAQADGKTEALGPDDLDMSEATVDDISAFILDNKLSVADTLELAGGDPEYAEMVLEAEQSGKGRVGVTVPLEKIIEDAEDEE